MFCIFLRIAVTFVDLMYSGKRRNGCFGVIISILCVSICSDANLLQAVYHEKLKLSYSLDAQESTIGLPGHSHKLQCLDTIIDLPKVTVTWQKDGVVVGKKAIKSNHLQSSSTSRVLSKRSLRKKRRADRSLKPSTPHTPPDLTPGAKPQNTFQLPQLSNASVNFSRHTHTIPNRKQPYTIYYDGALWISDVDASFKGLYECLVTDSYGTLLRRKFHFSLAEIPQCSINPPRQVVRSGSAARLNCSAVTLLNVSYTWYKDETPLTETEKYVFLSTGILQIYNVAASDAGTYRCRVKNKLGESSSQTAQIIVTETGYDPSIQSMAYKPQNLTLSPNKKFAAFECMANDLFCAQYGMHSVIGWNKTNGKICGWEERFPSGKICHKSPKKGNLLLTYLSKKDKGKYNCIMRCRSADKSYTMHNTISSAFLDILEKPIITVPPVLEIFPNRTKKTKYLLSGQLSISCSASGNPKPKLRWLKDGEIIKKDGYHHYIDDLSHLGEGFLLTVKGLKTYDGGYYQCIAENEFGSVSAAVRLELDIRDRIPPPSDLNATKVTATTISMHWTKPNTNRTVIAYIVNYVGEFGDGDNPNTAATELTLYNLHPYSWYTIEVTALIGNAQNESEIYRVQTTESAPSGKVKNMTYSMVNETTLIFEWQSLPLKERNGIITHYTINYVVDINSVIHNIEVPAHQPEAETWYYALIRELVPSYIGISVIAANAIGRSMESGFTNAVMAPPIDYSSTRCRDIRPPLKDFFGKFISYEELQVSWSFVEDSLAENIKIEIFSKNVLQYSTLLPRTVDRTVYDQANSTQPYVVRIHPLCYEDGIVCYNRSIVVLPSRAAELSHSDHVPSKLKGWAVKPDCVLLNWTCNNPRNLTYVVRYTMIHTGQRKFEADIAEQSITICGLEPWTEYEFTVAARSTGIALDILKFSSLGVTILTSEKIPGIPRDLKCIQTSHLHDGTAECSWSQPTNPNGEIVGYRVFYKEFGSLEWTTLTVEGNEEYVVLYCLRPQITYQIKVGAENIVGIGQISAETTMTTIFHDNNNLLNSNNSVCEIVSIPSDSKMVAVIVGVSIALVCLIICILLLVFCFPTSRCVHGKRFKCCQKIRSEASQLQSSRKEGIVNSTRNGVSLRNKHSVQVVIDQNGKDQRDGLLSGNGKISESDVIHVRKNGYKPSNGIRQPPHKNGYQIESQNGIVKSNGYVPVGKRNTLDRSSLTSVGNSKNESQNKRNSFPLGNLMRNLTRGKKPISESDNENLVQMPLLSIPIPRHSTSTSLSSPASPVLLPSSVHAPASSSKFSEPLPLKDIQPLFSFPIGNGTSLSNGVSCLYAQEAL